MGKPVEIIDGKKKCSKCKKEKSVNNFSIDKTLKCGYSSWCKECKSPEIDKWNKENQSTDEGKRRYRNNTLKFLYGISEKDFDQILKSQNNSCAICGGDLSVNRICVDHCHKTKKVRGLLCHNCNVGLGHFRDDAELLKKAINYLAWLINFWNQQAVK